MSSIDYHIARENMVSQQLRTWDVFDPRVLHVFATLPRENFLPDNFRHLAYADSPLPLESGLVLAPPREQARILQALAIKPTDKVLELGLGRDFMTACLSHLASTVSTLDFNQALNQKESFDVVLIHDSLEILPEKAKQLVNVGGRLFAILGNAPAMSATLNTRLSETDWRSQVLFETLAPRLAQAECKPQFEF